jgi:hypothetical protein
MLFIVLYHFIVHGVYDVFSEGLSDSALFFSSFLLVGVNCFILISGYFGIKQSWKGFLRLYFLCFSYFLLFAVLSKDYGKIYTAFFPFSHSHYNNVWFICEYFYLWLLSPLLNKIVEAAKGRKEFLILLICYGVFIFYFNWFWRSDSGYNVLNFMFLYLIGRFIALHTESTKNINSKRICLAAYFIFCLLSAAFLIMVMNLELYRYGARFFSYSSPFVIFASIALFLFFRNLNFTNKTVNWLSCSVLAIYLIHENPFVATKLYPFIRKFTENMDSFILLVSGLLGMAVVVVICCLLADKIRILLTNPLEKLLGKLPVEKWINKGIALLEINIPNSRRPL